MTPEQITQIRDRHQNALDYGPHHFALDDVGALLVELERVTKDLHAWKSAAIWRGAHPEGGES